MFVGKLWRQYFEEKFEQTGKGKRPKTLPRNQLKVLLLDLYVGWKQDPTMVIGVGLATASYKADSRYNALHISDIMPALARHAHEVGLIDWHKGSESARRTTRVWPTELLLKEFRGARFGLLDVGRHEEQELIVLSDAEFYEVDGKKKHRIELEYEDTDYPPIREMRTNLKAYNELLGRTFVDIPTLDRPFIEQFVTEKNGQSTKRVQVGQSNKLVRRIFYRGSWEFGGRLHGGWWQQVKSDWRKQIYINDEPTVEQDYSGMHVNLLYGLKGLPAVTDPYTVDQVLDMEPQEQRKHIKSLVLTAINAKTEKTAFQAFRGEQPKGAPAKSFKDVTLKTMLDAFKEKNAPIAEDLCTDRGVELMAIDGRITASIINGFTTKNIPILTIHDSYITSYEHTGLLRTMMNEATYEELGGLEINIDQEGVGIDQYRAFSNMDRANDYSYMLKSINTAERTQRYKHRLQQFEEYVKQKP